MKFNPMPGIVIVKLEEKESGLTMTTRNQTRLLKGKVLAVGPDVVTESGNVLFPNKYTSVGDTVYFLSYEGDYDNAVIDNEKYYMVKVQDLRTRI